MNEKSRSDLHSEAERVRAWLADHQWVDGYDRWWSEDGVVGAVQRFLAQWQPEDWSDADVTCLLYLLEESTTDYLAELVAHTESMTLSIAKHSLARGGTAGDDIATRLGLCTERGEAAEILLMEYMGAARERTRRIALLSLASLGSTAVPELAVAAWTSGDEHQRIGALSALKAVGSDLYPEYLSQALVDGREHLVAFAERCAAERNTDPPQPDVQHR